MNGFKTTLIALIALLALSGLAPRVAANDDAARLVERTAQEMLGALTERRADIDRNPQLIYRLASDIVVPRFDFDLMTQAAVGRDWRAATPQQRAALIDGFRELLVRTYATALLKYAGEDITVRAAQPGTREGTVLVPTLVHLPGAAAIPIDYRLHQRDGTWRVYDVVIENVSLISNYRNQFRAIIERGGIDGLLAELQAKNP